VLDLESLLKNVGKTYPNQDCRFELGSRLLESRKDGKVDATFIFRQ